jgi:raffinose/stachyose/melibiose transport system permease protein
MKKQKNVYFTILYVFLSLAGLYTLSPFILALVNSFKTNGELLSNIIAFPSKLQFTNYVRTFGRMNYLRTLFNTVLISGLSVVLIIFFSSMAGWKLSRTKTKLSAFLLALFVFSMLIPFSSIMIPLYKIILFFDIKNSLIGLSFVYVGTGASMAVFLYNGFVKSIPLELEESVAIDGCNSFQTYIFIIFPLLKTITATVCITNVIWIWNDFLLPLIVISDNKKYTLLLSTNTLFGQYSSDWTAILSALILAALPIIVFYVLLQKYIMSGISEGALKG